MRLDPAPFDEISHGLKTIESRLNDEKRQQIKIGDTIEFYKRPECKEKVEVKVLELHKYGTIKECVEDLPVNCWGPRFKSKEQLLSASWHYSEDEIKKYGLLAIKIERI